MLHAGRSSSDVLTCRQGVPESSTKGGTPRLSTQEPRGQMLTDCVLQPVGDGSGPHGASRSLEHVTAGSGHGCSSPSAPRKGLRMCQGVGYTELPRAAASGGRVGSGP